MISKRRAKRGMTAMDERKAAKTETRVSLSPWAEMPRMMMTMVSKLSRTRAAREDKIGRDNNSRVTVTPMMASRKSGVAAEAAEAAEVAEVGSSRTPDVVEQLLQRKIEKSP